MTKVTEVDEPPICACCRRRVKRVALHLIMSAVDMVCKDCFYTGTTLMRRGRQPPNFALVC